MSVVLRKWSAGVGTENKDYFYIFRIVSEIKFNVKYIIKLHCICSIFADNLLSDNA